MFVFCSCVFWLSPYFWLEGALSFVEGCVFLSVSSVASSSHPWLAMRCFYLLDE